MRNFLKLTIFIPDNSIESRRVSQLCQYGFQEKITVGVAWSWLVYKGMARSSNIFIPSVHSVGESLSQVPGQLPCELLKSATHRNIDAHPLSF